jgi:transcriptional regulator with XRE-family HTH domain
LGTTLAQRIRELREFRNMTQVDLAKACRFPLKRVEELESGFETWLSAPDRQMLAKSLVIDPALLKDVEVRPPISEESTEALEQQLVRAILSGHRELECPKCGASLHCGVQDAFDIEDKPVRFAKAFCTRCPYILKS